MWVGEKEMKNDDGENREHDKIMVNKGKPKQKHIRNENEAENLDLLMIQDFEKSVYLKFSSQQKRGQIKTSIEFNMKIITSKFTRFE